MEEGQWLLLQEQEDGIKELEIFRQIVQVINNNQFLGVRVDIADTIEQSVTKQNWNQLLHCQSQERAGEKGQKDIVDLEEGVQSQSLPIGHNGLTAEDDDVVNGYDRQGMGKSRDGCLAVLELELFGRVAYD